MPSVSISNFENDELISARLLSFMNSHDQSSSHSDSTGNGNKFTSNVSFGAPLTDLDIHLGSNLRSPLHRNGSTHSMANLQDRVLNGSPNECNSASILASASSPGFMSGSCTPPPSVLPSSSISGNFLPVRSHYAGAPSYSALTSPCLGSKTPGSANMNHLLNYNGAPGSGECHSLQNSPFYNHYPLNGGLQTQFQRQLGGISPGPMGTMLPNGVGSLNGGMQNLGSRTGLYAVDNAAFPLNNLRPSGCPQRELFPTAPLAGQTGVSGQSIFGAGLLMQDRLRWYELAQKQGFIVGPELERVKENSCRSTSQSYGRIAAHFRNRYGETEAKTKAAYLQIGVRVPSKDHVSEIVGKGGQKIKLIREETGALITTPGEHEEHVFIIEAPPEIAMRVAQHLTTRAQEITQSKLAAGERRRGSTSSQPTSMDANGGGLLLTGSGSCFNGTAGPSLVSNQSNGSGGLLVPNGGTNGVCAGASSGLLSLTNSASNSPMHPSSGALGSSLIATSVNGTRNGCSGLFSSHLSSLPNSPCGGGSCGTNGGLTGHGQASLFLSGNNTNGSGSTTPGSRILLARSRISVPQEMVGKIIGTQGSIITTIQKDTGTEIKSPPKEAARGPNATSEFEISAYQGLGLSSNQAAECRVQQAKQLIGHLVMRQLERRASEEIEEASGSANLSAEMDQQRLGACNNTPRSGGGASGSTSVNTTTANGWMWPDVAQMDSQEAREVLDRILAESKNKTRRAKELAAAAAAVSPVTTGQSPTSNGSVSALNMTGCVSMPSSVLVGTSDHSHGSTHPTMTSPHQRFHTTAQLLGPAVSLFDPGSSDGQDCIGSELGLAGMGGNHQHHHNDGLSLPVSMFSPHSNHFGPRNGGGSLNSSDETLSHQQHSIANGHQMCNQRNVQCFSLSEQNELFSGFSRAPGPNLGTDLWSTALPGFNGADSAAIAPPPSMQHPLLGSSGLTLNSLFTSAPTTGTTTSTSSMTTNTGKECLNGFGSKHLSLPGPNGSLLQGTSDFHDPTGTSVFNFNDSFGSPFGSASGDLSPTLLMHYRSQHPEIMPHQPLARRHSDWVVSSANLFPPDVPGLRHAANTSPSAINRHTAMINHRLFPNQTGQGLRCDNDSNTTRSIDFTSSSSSCTFDFIKALDQLCLHSAGTNDPVTTIPVSSIGSAVPHCPPGFEHQPTTQPPQRQTPVSTESLYSAFPVKSEDQDCSLAPTISTNNNGIVHANGASAVWSVIDTTSNSPYIMPSSSSSSSSSVSTVHTATPSDFLGPNSFGKNSLLRRLFTTHNPHGNNCNTNSNCSLDPISGEQDRDACDVASNAARLNAIWSQAAQDPASSVNPQDACCDDCDDDLVVAFPYLSAAVSSHGQSDSYTTSGSAVFLSYSDNSEGVVGSANSATVENSVARCCGAIGEGRRRTRLSPPVLASDLVDPLTNVSVASSAIASTTEVA